MVEIVDALTARSSLTGSEGVRLCRLAENRPQPLVLPLYVMPIAPDQEQLRILLISSPGWVRETIHDLHGRGFANVKDWSSLQPGANPGEVVSILTRRRSRL